MLFGGDIGLEVYAPVDGDETGCFNLGKIYEDQGNWDQALEMWRTYSKGIEAGSDAWLDARYRIAMAHSKMGRGSEACEVITMIRVLHPDAGDEALRVEC